MRTRSSAAALAASGRVRVNGLRVRAASRPVRCQDVVTVALDGGVRVLKVLGFAARRGDGEAGSELYEDLGPGRIVGDRRRAAANLSHLNRQDFAYRGMSGLRKRCACASTHGSEAVGLELDT